MTTYLFCPVTRTSAGPIAPSPPWGGHRGEAGEDAGLPPPPRRRVTEPERPKQTSSPSGPVQAGPVATRAGLGDVEGVAGERELPGVVEARGHDLQGSAARRGGGIRTAPAQTSEAAAGAGAGRGCDETMSMRSFPLDAYRVGGTSRLWPVVQAGSTPTRPLSGPGPGWADRFGRVSVLRFSGPVLPDGEPATVRRRRPGHPEPQAGAETVGQRLGRPRPRRRALPRRARRARRGRPRGDRAAGGRRPGRRRPAAPRRGSPADTRWVQDRDDLPRLIRPGRHIARTRRYIRDYAHEVEPDELPTYVAQEARRGDGWVKLVGDWIERDLGDLAPSWPADAFTAAIAAAHARGREGHRALLRHRGAADPDRRRHRLHRARHRADRGPDRRDGRARHRARPDGRCSSTTSRSTPTRPRTSSRRTPPHARPARAAPRHDHGGLRGRRADLRRHRRRRGAAARRDRRRGGRARGVRHPRRGRPGRRLVEGARVAGPQRHPRRGRARGLRGLRRGPARTSRRCVAGGWCCGVVVA